MRQKRQRSLKGKKKPNYALRRALVAGVLLIIVALLVWSVSSVVSMLIVSSEPTGDASVQSRSATPQSSQGKSDNVQSNSEFELQGESSGDGVILSDGTVSIPACDATMLRVQVDSTAVDLGSSVQVHYRLTNVGTHACHISTEDLSLNVKNGADSYFDRAQCADDSTGTRLLLTPKMSWTGVVSWNGAIHQGCEAIDTDNDGKADIAQAGTYSAVISLPGNKEIASATIVIR